MKRLRKWMLVSVCAALGAAAVPYAALLVLSHTHWWAFLGLKQFDWVSRDALVDCTVLGFILGVTLALGALGGVLAGQRIERTLASTGGQLPNRQTA